MWGRELYFDATKVEANAGIPSLIPRYYFEAKTLVADLFQDETDDSAPQADTELPLGITKLPIAPVNGSAEADPPWRLLEERRLDPNCPSHRGHRRTSDFRVSPTDPNASPMWDWDTIRLGYHDPMCGMGKFSARFRMSRMWRWLRLRDTSGHDGPRDEAGEPP